MILFAALAVIGLGLGMAELTTPPSGLLRWLALGAVIVLCLVAALWSLREEKR